MRTMRSSCSITQAGKEHERHHLADASPGRCRLSQTPISTTASMVSVVDARVRTATTRPPGEHRDLRRQQPAGQFAQARHLRFDPREALHQRDVAKRVGGAFGEIGVMAFDRVLHAFGLANDECRQGAEQAATAISSERQVPIDQQRERQQHEHQHQRREIVAEEVDPDVPQRIGAGDHHLHQASGMRGAVEAQRQLQDVFEIGREDDLAPAMGKPIRMQRDERAAQYGEQPKADPGGDQPSSRCPDAALVSASRMRPNRTGSRKLRARQCQVGKREQPAESRFVAKQARTRA